MKRIFLINIFFIFSVVNAYKVVDDTDKKVFIAKQEAMLQKYKQQQEAKQETMNQPGIQSLSKAEANTRLKQALGRKRVRTLRRNQAQYRQLGILKKRSKKQEEMYKQKVWLANPGQNINLLLSSPAHLQTFYPNTPLYIAR